jgi:outer membrane protein OmpA-like peptidoglycan-associated protein
MNRRSSAVILGAVAVVLAEGCGPQKVAPPAPPPSPELIVLLADPDNGAIGRASVASGPGTVDLIGDRSATRVLANRPPTPPEVLDEAEVQRVFGGALAALPMAPALFNLYFKFDSDELTDESRALVPKILEAVTSRPAPDVVVVGHTDTTGSSRANFELGLKRAGTIRNLLVRAGLEASLMELASHGEADLLVPTADETPEPRNRRVEIAVR